MSHTFSLKSDLISRFPHQGPVLAPRWVPMLCVSCVDQWADLIWADPSDALLSPILCRCSQMPHWPPWWASGGLYLNPADSNKHIHHRRPLPSRLTAVKTKSLWRSNTVTARQFSEEKASLCYSKHFPPEVVKIRASTEVQCNCLAWKSLSVNLFLPVICSHLCWLSLTFILTLAPLGVVGPEPLSFKSY